MAQSRQGRLFKQITETPFREIPWDVFCDYAGYKRGLEAFVKIVQKENKKLPYDFSDDPRLSWNCNTDYNTTSLEGLMMVIGRMGTRRSFEVLMNFATGEYHPYVRCEAVWGLTWTDHDRRKVKELAVKLIKSPRNNLDTYSGLLVFEFWHYEPLGKTAFDAIAACLDHRTNSFRTTAVFILSKKRVGKKILREYAKGLRRDGTCEADEDLYRMIDGLTRT